MITTENAPQMAERAHSFEKECAPMISAPEQGNGAAMPLICGMMMKRITEDNMNQRFLDQITDFIFVNDIPGRADMIMVPGNGFPQMAEGAAQRTMRDMHR